MVKLVNRAKMTTATTGTGPITLASASTGYQTFAAAGVTNSQVVRYVIEDGVNWEIGSGTYTSSGTSLSRTPTESSSGGSAISLTGAATVYVSATSNDLVPYDSGTPVSVSFGGTGQASDLTQGGVVYASSTTAMATTAVGTSGKALISAGTSAPAFGTLSLSGGGTGVTTAQAAAAQLMGFTTTPTSGTLVSLSAASSSQYQLFTGTVAQTIQLPDTSTLVAGWTFHIVNNSTANLTVNSFGVNLVCTVIPQTTAMLTCINTGLNSASAWEFGFTDFSSITGTGSAVLSTSPTITSPTITSGILNGTVGATTPSTGAFTSLTSTSGGINGTVGATTPSTGDFTTITGTTSIAVPLVTNAGTLALTATGANIVNVSTNGILRQTYGSDGSFAAFQGAPAATVTGAGTLTFAQISTGLIYCTGATGYTLTTATGAVLDASYSAAANMSFDFSIINDVGGVLTIALGATGVTKLGTLTIPTLTSSRWRFRRTGASAWVLYRLS